MNTDVMPQGELPIHHDDDAHRRMVEWIRESADVQWLPAYEGPAALLASSMLAISRDPDAVSTADKVMATRLMEQFGLTPLSNARLKRWIAEQPGLSSNEFQEFKPVHR